MKKDEYKKGIEADKKAFADYFRNSIKKTEQQKLLEQHLRNSFTNDPLTIADIACGGGTLSYHLAKKFPNSSFILADFSDDAISMAQQLNKRNKNFAYLTDDIYALKSIPDSSCDIVFCWQTLSWLDHPQQALLELIRIAKKGGIIFLSSLFNLDRDVDIYARVLDHTRESSKAGIMFNYNTYSGKTFSDWAGNEITSIEYIPFVPKKDFAYDGRGLGTSTIKSPHGRLQVSGGYLMNWSIVKIIK